MSSPVHRITGNKLHSFELDHTHVADYYKGGPNDGYSAYVFTDELSADEIVRLRNLVEASVKKELAIPYPTSQTALKYEHSMGQVLPDSILRSKLSSN